MSKALVIVESPAKAKTISKYLGNDYVVEASVGHIMDLPKNDIGVELKHRTFEPTLIVSPGKEKIVAHLKKLAAKSDAVYLAPDPDREGEAIAAHLEMQLRPSIKKGATLQRVTFNEITPKAVKAAFAHARDVDKNLMYAQQTRRVLDRLVGYQISPLLWDKVRRGLSAGRVQTVALRLIVEREREINAFVPVEYWIVGANLRAGGAMLKTDSGQEFFAKFTGVDGVAARVANGADKDGKELFLSGALANEEQTLKVVEQLGKAAWSVAQVERKERRQNPRAPYITSKLQQDAAGRLGFNVRRTMGVAQRLYEGVELGKDGTVGLITYMRTDSTRVSPDAIVEARAYVQKKHGAKYLPKEGVDYKGKKDAQDAHEAIRPTNVEYTPDSIKKWLSDEQYKLYKMIWQRFVASQMVPAVFDQTTVEIAAKADRTYDFRVTGSIMKFDGFLAVWDGESEDTPLPELRDGQALAMLGIEHEQKFTEPPPRYNEASLVKTLEERGIGRPSTYASIINTIQERDYVKKIKSKLVPTEIGMVVTELLVKNFPYIFKFDYTAQLEGELDAVEDGTEKWTDLLKGFYDHFEEELKVAERSMEDIKRKEDATDEVCPKCGSPLVLKWGKFGSFYACSNFTKAKAMTVAAAPWKKDPKALMKKLTSTLHFPMTVKALTGDVIDFSRGAADAKELASAIADAAGRGKKITVEQISCDFTKENFAAKPDLNSPDAQDGEAEEEFCDNCGRVMVLRNGPFGAFMSCPDYNADPPCKTIRKLSQKQQQKPPVPLNENCPKCGMQLVMRSGQYGEFISCSGYPKCKYIKQTLLDVKCPKDGGDLAERKARTGNVFYGCVNYPKCDFTSNQKLIDETCPKCDAAYLVEVVNESGTHWICPNNVDALPKRRRKKGEEEPARAVVCHFEKKVADAAPKPVVAELARPDPEKTRPLVETVA